MSPPRHGIAIDSASVGAWDRLMRSHLILALALVLTACGGSPKDSNDGGTNGSGEGSG